MHYFDIEALGIPRFDRHKRITRGCARKGYEKPDTHPHELSWRLVQWGFQRLWMVNL